MKTKILFKTLLLLLCLVAGVNVGWATETAIPLTVGNYLTTSTSVTTGTIKNDDGGNLGGIYKDATATFTLTNESAQDMVLTFLTGNNNNSNPRVTVTMNDGIEDFFTYAVDIENTGSWTPITKHVFDVGEVPAGTVTLKFVFTNTSSYVCNLGSIGVYNKAAYIASLDEMPGDITLSKGSYQGGARYNDSGNGKVGWLSNNTYCYYPDLYVTSAGTATLNIGMTHNGDGTMNVKVVDATTGETEIDENISITSSVCKGLTTPTSFELDDLTAGFKTLKLTMSTEASYLIDYQDLSLSIDSWTPIAINLRDGQLGTTAGTPYTKYLAIDGSTYTYTDDNPGSYNAILSCARFHDNSHGYVNFKAKVPVKAGIYKITLGTCAWGSNACVKNSDESSTLNVTDVNGQTVTSVNQNTGACYHQNTTENVVSMWYEAESDETITIVCGNYTPYFAIEKVTSVPDLKYTYTFVNDTEGASGTVPAAGSVAGGDSFTLPVNRTLFKSGYTLTGWNDGTTTYAPGDSYTPTQNTTLTAVFTDNAYDLGENLTDVTVKWDFQRGNGCPTISSEGGSAFLVTQAEVNGNNIDVKLDINTNPGKFNNVSWTDWAQVNEGTTFSFPAKDDAVVTAYSMNEPKNGTDVKSSLDGNDYSSYSSNVATYSASPTDGVSTLTIKGGSYYRYLQMVYPAIEVTGITSITVGGIAVGGDVIAAINFSGSKTATLSGNVYTSEPTVEVTLSDASSATITPSGSGTTRTYTITGMDNTYTLNVEGIHLYSKGVGEETVNLKYTSDGNDKENEIWTNGVYSVSPVGDGWNNSGFKLNKKNNPFTLTVPSDVQVKQFIIHEFKDNYTEGAFNTITSEGMTTAYIPTKHNLPNTDGEKYDLIINLDDHQAGEPIVFSFTGGSQITGWYELTIAHSNPGTAPVKTDESVTVVNNHAAVAVTFDREIPGDVEATINNTTVTAEGGASTLYFPIWDLSYSTNYTLTIAAGAVEDAYGNYNASAIEIAVNVPAKPSVTAAEYDYVVGTASEFSTAIAAVNSSNTSASAARKTIFIKNGDYDFGSTEQRISGYNVSLIGESRDGVVLHGNRSGISNPVLNIRDRSGFYLQDLTVKNDFDYGTGSFNGVAVAIYGGDKTIMKNVRMLSNQDTQVTGHRAYFEDCQIHGTVDFICGGGDNFYYNTDLVLENRGGNCITAPSTNSSTKWGYVFQECTIKAVDATAATTNAGSYYLGRPWQNEPRAYYLNTTMEVLPATAGWTSMNTLPTHFYEYNSMNGSGVALDLSGRTNSPTSTNTYTPVLTSGEAANFTLKNVLGGTDSWLPTDYTTVTDAPEVSASGSTISWDAVDDARCYVIFKDAEYLANQTATSYEITSAGVYTVRAANEMGGLGETSNAVVSGVITPAGWSSFASSYPLDLSSIENGTAYYASAASESTVTLSTTDATVPAGEGIMVKGTADEIFVIKVAANGDAIDGNLLKGQTTTGTVDASTAGAYHYVFGYESSSVYGFYNLASDTTIPAGKAYLETTTALSSGARALRIVFDDITGIDQIDNGKTDNSLPAKRIVNGKLIIEKNGQKFNAAGTILK